MKKQWLKLGYYMMLTQKFVHLDLHVLNHSHTSYSHHYFLQSKPLVNKLFMQNKVFRLRMDENGKVTEHMNVYNSLVSQTTSVGIKIVEEDKCIALLCYLSNS